MTEQPRTVTLHDVAAAAGVATSTASRAFARPGLVNAATAARIRQVADELGYRSSPIGSAAASSDTLLIGLVVSDVANPYYSHLIRGAQIAATDAGYELLLADSQESAARERAVLERLVPVVEGFIIGSSRMSDAGLRSIAKQRPLIVLNRALPDVPSVVTDHRAGIRAAVEHLRGLGHESVTYVCGPEASWTDGARFQAIRAAGQAAGVTIHRVGHFAPTFEGGLAASRVLLERLPTAVFGYNDLLAIGVMHGLLRAGVDVPEQVSVVGFDDILTARLTHPTLTTVATDRRLMGATAMNNVVALIKGAKHRTEEASVLPVQLKVRGSTARVREQAAAQPATRLR